MLKRTLLISIGVLSILLYSLPTSVFALTVTTVVKGTIGSVISVNLPAEILVASPNGVLTLGSNPCRQKTITVEAYGNWIMTARDLANNGYMKKNGTSLTNRLQVGDVSDSGQWTTADVGLTYTGTGNQTKYFYANQEVLSGDAPGNYTITITFTLTQSA